MALTRLALQRVAAAPAARSMPVRAFAADHAPPVKLFGIPARYANATYTAASKAGVLDKVEMELLAFKDVLGKNSGFADFLSNPTVSRDDKVTTIDKMFEGGKTQAVTKNLMSTMAANNRLEDAGKVADAYAELMKAKRGELDAVVTTAVALTKAQAKTVSDALKAQAGGKAVSITTKVDQSILGGLTVQIGDKYMDMSVKSKIDKVTANLASA